MTTRTHKLSTFIKGLILGILIGGIAVFLLNRHFASTPHTSDETDAIVDGVIEEHATGYTAIDFQDAILGEAEGHKELIVMEQPVQYTTTLSQEGPWQWEVFRKTKGITYHGTGVYAVNLANINSESIEVNEEEKLVTVSIPGASLTYINPDYDRIEFEDTEKGLLAFSDIKLTAEQQNELEKAVIEGMREILSEDDVLNQADEFSKMKVWELLQPVVSAISPEYRLVVDN